MLLDIDTGVKEAQLLHPEQYGYFALFRKNASGRGRPSQRMYQMAHLQSVVQAMQHQPDAYISQASFVTTSRRETALHQIRSVFVDLDCYTLGLEPDESFLAQVLEQAQLVGIPAPSYVVQSGRGLYAKWLFTQPVGAASLPMWKSLQASIVSIYRRLGADLKVRDSSRVLRIIGTTNSKVDPTTQMGQVAPVFNSGELYDFTQLCKKVAAVDLSRFGLVDERKLEQAISRIKQSRMDAPEIDGEQCIEHLTFYAQTREPILVSRLTTQGLNWRRFLDLRDLAAARGGIHQGSRDMMLFWMLSFLAHSEIVTADNFFAEARELSRGFAGSDFDPISDGSLQTLAQKVTQRRAGMKVEFRGAKFDPVYTPSNDYLIDVLQISDKEMEGLRTIISGREKLRRKDAKCEGRSERRVARIQWRAQATTLLAEGKLTQTEVAAAVGVSKAQISRLVAGKLKTPATVAATLGLQTRTRAPSKRKVPQEALDTPALAAHDASRSQPITEEEAYAQILAMSQETRRDLDSERLKRQRELCEERERLRMQAVSTAERLLQKVKASASIRTAAPTGEVACGHRPQLDPPTQVQDDQSGLSCQAALSRTETDMSATPPPKTPSEDSTRASARDSARDRSRELLKRARDAKAMQAAGLSPSPSVAAPQTPPAMAEMGRSVGADHGGNHEDAATTVPVSADQAAPLHQTHGEVLVQGSAPDQPAKTSPFASLVSRPPPDSATPRREELAELQATEPGPAVPGARLSFAELARRGAARKEELAQAELAMRSKSKLDDLPPDPPWNEPQLPAGSRYSLQEWEQARQEGRFHVFELHVGGQSGLVQMEKAPARQRRRQVIDGKLVERQESSWPQDFIDETSADLVDGCLLIGPKGRTDYPRAASGRLVYNHPQLGPWEYRIIRPQSQAESHAYLATVSAEYWPNDPDADQEDEATSRRPRSRQA